jgi:hypothetical protein
MDRVTSFLKQHAGLLGLAAVLVGLLIISPMAGLVGSGIVGVGMAVTTQDTIKALIAWGLLDSAGGLKRVIIPKTADYTITTGTDPSGAIFTNRGASGTVIFTLPAPAAALAGVFYEFLGITDFTITVKTATADTLVVTNDTAADSLSASTASHKIGAHMRVLCDGVAWVAYGDSVGDTFTVAT